MPSKKLYRCIVARFEEPEAFLMKRLGEEPTEEVYLYAYSPAQARFIIESVKYPGREAVWVEEVKGGEPDGKISS